MNQPGTRLPNWSPMCRRYRSIVISMNFSVTPGLSRSTYHLPPNQPPVGANRIEATR